MTTTGASDFGKDFFIIYTICTVGYYYYKWCNKGQKATITSSFRSPMPLFESNSTHLREETKVVTDRLLATVALGIFGASSLGVDWYRCVVAVFGSLEGAGKILGGDH